MNIVKRSANPGSEIPHSETVHIYQDVHIRRLFVHYERVDVPVTYTPHRSQPRPPEAGP